MRPRPFLLYVSCLMECTGGPAASALETGLHRHRRGFRDGQARKIGRHRGLRRCGRRDRTECGCVRLEWSCRRDCLPPGRGTRTRSAVASGRRRARRPSSRSPRAASSAPSSPEADSATTSPGRSTWAARPRRAAGRQDRWVRDPARGHGHRRTVTASGGCGIPLSATAIAATVTAPTPAGHGFLRMYPAASAEPQATALSYLQGLSGNTGTDDPDPARGREVAPGHEPPRTHESHHRRGGLLQSRRSKA